MSWPPLPPRSEVVDLAWRVVLPAGGLAFVMPLAARGACGRAAPPFAIAFGTAAGLAAAFTLRDAVPWRPEDYGSAWMHGAWGAALVGGWLAALLPVGWNWLPKLASVAAAVWVTLPYDRRDGSWWFAALAAAMAIPWLSVPSTAGVAAKRSWPERASWLTLATAALAVVALHAHYLRVADFAVMAACASAGGASACALLGRDARELEGVGYVTLPALALCLWNDVESAIPAVGFVCVGLAALPMVAFRWLPRDGWRAFASRGAAVLVPAATAALLAMAFEEASYG